MAFSGIERLRNLERSLRDLDGLIVVLSRIVERFSGIAKKTEEEVRLFITSTGKGLSFQMVYEVVGPAAPKPGKVQAKDKTREARQITPNDIQRWIDYGLKALSNKAPNSDSKFETAPAE